MQSGNAILKLDGYQLSIDTAYYLDGYLSATTFTSAPVKVGRKTGWSLTLSCPATGTPVGSVKVQACNDASRQDSDNADALLVNWFDIIGAVSAVSGASIICIEDRKPQYRWMRIVYTRTSGSITATARLHVKQRD